MREWSNIGSVVIPEYPLAQPEQEKPEGKPPRKLKCPARGRYQGKTSQGYKICFTLSRNGKRVTRLETNYRLRCDFGRIEGESVITSATKVRRSGAFQTGSEVITLKGKIKGLRARGTLRGSHYDPDIGDCDSGLVRWSARRK